MAIETNSSNSLNSQDSNSSLRLSTERPSHRQRQSSQSWKAYAETLPAYSYKDSNSERQLFYVWEIQQVDGIAKRLDHSNNVLGFDLEWKPNRLPGQDNPVALVQLAGQNEVQLHHVHGFAYFPENLRAILESPTILKVGVGIENDVKKLAEEWDVQVKHFLDLGPLARTLDPYWQAECPGGGAIPLGRLVARYQKKKLDKAQQCSNWESRLNKPQKDYAANDGCAGFDVYQTLMAIHNGSVSLAKFDVPQPTVNTPSPPPSQQQQRPSPQTNIVPLYSIDTSRSIRLPLLHTSKPHQRNPSVPHTPYPQPPPQPIPHHNFNPQFISHPLPQFLYQPQVVPPPGFRWPPVDHQLTYPPQFPVFTPNPPPLIQTPLPFYHHHQTIPYHGPPWDVPVHVG